MVDENKHDAHLIDSLERILASVLKLKDLRKDKSVYFSKCKCAFTSIENTLKNVKKSAITNEQSRVIKKIRDVLHEEELFAKASMSILKQENWQEFLNVK